MAGQPQMIPGAPKAQYFEDFTVYEIDVAGLAPAAVANGNIQIQADSSFKWIKSTYTADIAAAAFLSAFRCKCLRPCREAP